MQVKSIAGCSPFCFKGSILQYFQPSLSYRLSLRPLFCLFLSGRFTQVLLNLFQFVKFPPFILTKTILNKILTWVTGHNPIINMHHKLMCDNLNLDLVNINAYATFCQLPLIHSKILKFWHESWAIFAHINTYKSQTRSQDMLWLFTRTISVWDGPFK